MNILTLLTLLDDFKIDPDDKLNIVYLHNFIFVEVTKPKMRYNLKYFVDRSDGFMKLRDLVTLSEEEIIPICKKMRKSHLSIGCIGRYLNLKPHWVRKYIDKEN